MPDTDHRAGAYGAATRTLVQDALARGARHIVALMRHSARTFEPGLHDLDNRLTDAGRLHARDLGAGLPKSLLLRGYASPPHRCMETAELILAGHAAAGGAVSRHRPLEALGVFYALDQRKMWKGMQSAGGLASYMSAWTSGQVPVDAMMPADLAARLVLRVMLEKLRAPLAAPQLDLCVTHDMTLYLVRDRLLDISPSGPAVAFLDAVIAYELDGQCYLESAHGPARLLAPEMLTLS